VISIYAQTNHANQNFDIYIYKGSNEIIVSFIKELRDSVLFYVEKAENFDGSSYITLMVNDFIKATEAAEGPFRIFTVIPEVGYLVDQMKLDYGNFLYIYFNINHIWTGRGVILIV